MAEPEGVRWDAEREVLIVRLGDGRKVEMSTAEAWQMLARANRQLEEGFVAEGDPADLDREALRAALEQRGLAP